MDDGIKFYYVFFNKTQRKKNGYTLQNENIANRIVILI